MRKLISDKRGFSLIELIVAMAILGTVLALASSIFIQASKVQNKIIKRVSYQDAATNIITLIKSNIKDTNYLTITSSDTDSAGVAAGGMGRFFVKGDYDGVYFQVGTNEAHKMYGIKDLNGTKLKLDYKCEPAATDGRYSVLTINMAFYDAVIADADIAADTAEEKAIYTHNATIYLQNLAFGLKISDGSIEAQKSNDHYNTFTDNEKEAYENNMMNSKASGFVGKCIRYKIMN